MSERHSLLISLIISAEPDRETDGHREDIKCLFERLPWQWNTQKRRKRSPQQMPFCILGPCVVARWWCSEPVITAVNYYYFNFFWVTYPFKCELWIFGLSITIWLKHTNCFAKFILKLSFIKSLTTYALFSNISAFFFFFGNTLCLRCPCYTLHVLTNIITINYA